MSYAKHIERLALALLTVSLLVGCGEGAGGSATSSEDPVIGGKGDTLHAEALDSSRRDDFCSEYQSYRDPDCFIRVASWNIKDLSANKVADEDVVERIAEILSHFDVVAVQEVSNIKELDDPNCERNDVCPDHENCGAVGDALSKALADVTDKPFELAFSPQVHGERYLYVYNSEQVELLEDRLVEDPEETKPTCTHKSEGLGQMIRQPHLGVFEAGNFSFGLLNAHIKPAKAPKELEHLANHQKRLQKQGVSDLMMLGDLNSACQYFDPEEQADHPIRTGYLWLLEGHDTTLSDTDCAFDQIIIPEMTFEDITGDIGVFKDIEREVSDHYPVWAHFYLGRDTDEHTLD